ncbi:hypothetical protein OQA88_12624 [Cercophora sp. LCS_1]
MASSPSTDVEWISLLDPTFDQVVQCIVDARNRSAVCFVQFPWPEEQFHDFRSLLYDRLYQLDIAIPQRVEYDFDSKTVQLDMAESPLHGTFGCFSALLLRDTLGFLVPSIQNAAIRLRLKAVINFATSRLEIDGELSRQPDWAFGCAINPMPSLVCEVAFAQSWNNVEAKALQYIKSSGGKIRAVIVFNINYPKANKVTVSLVTADNSIPGGHHWLQYAEILYSDNTEEQAIGQIDPADLPASFCRPSAAEVNAGVQREPQIVLTYGQLRREFRKALAVYREETYLEDFAEETIFEKLARKVEEAARKEEEMARKEQDVAIADMDCAITDMATIAEKDRAITDMAHTIAEKDCAITDMAHTIAEKDCAIAEKDCAITNMAHTIAEKDCAITNMAHTIAEKDRAIADMARAIAELTRTIA